VSAPRPGRPEASALIWRWRETASGTEVPAARVRLRAALQAGAGAAVGAALLAFGARPVAYLAFAMAALVLVSALVSPHGLHAGLQRLFEATGRAVGRATTWIVMLPLFYLFFLPFGKLRRRGRRDRLRRYFEPDAETYWEPHSEVPSSSRERQY
jgi:hypothetical protein